MEVFQNFFFIFQIVLSIFIIFLVLIQNFDEDALSNSSYSSNNKMFKKSFSTPISKFTMIIFILFMLNSLFLAILSGKNNTDSNIDKYLNNNVNVEKASN